MEQMYCQACRKILPDGVEVCPTCSTRAIKLTLEEKTQRLLPVPEPTEPFTIESTGIPVCLARNVSISIAVKGNGQLRKTDLAQIAKQFGRWIDGIEEAFNL